MCQQAGQNTYSEQLIILENQKTYQKLQEEYIVPNSKELKEDQMKMLRRSLSDSIAEIYIKSRPGK